MHGPTNPKALNSSRKYCYTDAHFPGNQILCQACRFLTNFQLLIMTTLADFIY